MYFFENFESGTSSLDQGGFEFVVNTAGARTGVYGYQQVDEENTWQGRWSNYVFSVGTTFEAWVRLDNSTSLSGMVLGIPSSNVTQGYQVLISASNGSGSASSLQIRHNTSGNPSSLIGSGPLGVTTNVWYRIRAEWRHDGVYAYLYDTNGTRLASLFRDNIFDTGSTHISGYCGIVTLRQASFDDILFEKVKTFDQRAFRFRNDNGDEISATWKGQQSASIQLSPGSRFRLRIELQELGGNASVPTNRLQYRKNQGPWTTLGSLGDARFFNSLEVAHNTGTTDQLTAGTGAFRRGEVFTTNNLAIANPQYLGYDHTELEWSITLDGDLEVGDLIEFRVQQNFDGNFISTDINTAGVPGVSVSNRIFTDYTNWVELGASNFAYPAAPQTIRAISSATVSKDSTRSISDSIVVSVTSNDFGTPPTREVFYTKEGRGQMSADITDEMEIVVTQSSQVSAKVSKDPSNDIIVTLAHEQPVYVEQEA